MVDAIVGAWFAERTREEAMAVMEAANVIAAPIHDAADVAQDPHFHERGVYVVTDDLDIGSAVHHAPHSRLSATPATLRHPAPTLGQDTDAVLNVPGYATGEIARLRGDGVVQ